MIMGFTMKLYEVQEVVYEKQINKKWWEYMADIMETNPDNSPVCVNLKKVFHLD